MPVYSDEPGKVNVIVSSAPAFIVFDCKPIVSNTVVKSKSNTTKAMSPTKLVVALFFIEAEIVKPLRYSISYWSVVKLDVSCKLFVLSLKEGCCAGFIPIIAFRFSL